MCSQDSPNCWSCIAACAQAQYYWEIKRNDKLGTCIPKGNKCKYEVKECTNEKVADCGKKGFEMLQKRGLCQGQIDTLQEMGQGVVVS